MVYPTDNRGIVLGDLVSTREDPRIDIFSYGIVVGFWRFQVMTHKIEEFLGVEARTLVEPKGPIVLMNGTYKRFWFGDLIQGILTKVSP
jgi:hypothetical protein